MNLKPNATLLRREAEYQIAALNAFLPAFSREVEQARQAWEGFTDAVEKARSHERNAQNIRKARDTGAPPP